MTLSLCWFRASVLSVLLLLVPAIGAAQTGADLVLVSPYKTAAYNDIVIDASGVVHAVWQADPQESLTFDLFYGSSGDGGETWNEPIQLADGRPTAPVGIPVLVQDGSGRLYAFWKELVVGLGGLDEFEERTDAPLFGTLYYRVLEQGRWSDRGQIGSARSILSWHASVDPSGAVSVLWSQSPAPPNFFSSEDDVTLLYAVQVSGSALGTPRTVLESDNGALWGVSGYVDAGGVARGFLLKNSAHPVLVRFDGAQESPVFEAGEMLRNYQGHRLPTVVLDEAGNEHVLLYSGNPATPAILDYSGGTEPIVVLSAAGGEVEHFQITRSPRGDVVLAVAARPQDGSAMDLYVAELRGGEWSQPRNVTVNQRRADAGGVWSGTGTTYGTNGVWHAVRGAATRDANGRIGVLLTNRRAGGSGTSGQTVGSDEYVYFAWAGEGTGRTPAAPTTPPPAPQPVPEGPAPTPTPLPAPQTPPAPAPQPTPAPQPARPAVDGIPAGRYSCHYVSQYAGPIPVAQNVRIIPGGNYEDVAGSAGTYVMEGGVPRWISGGFAQGRMQATFSRNDSDQPMLTVTGAGDDTLYCVLYSGY